MKKTNIAVFVSGGGTNLEAILGAAEGGRIPHGNIALVLASKPGVYALERAKNHGIPSVVVSRREDPEHFEEKIDAALAEYGIEMIVLAGFLSILSADFTERWDGRIINVHPSLIPSFCGKGFYGLKVHEAALDYGVKVTGATVHYVNSVPDGVQMIILAGFMSILSEDFVKRYPRHILNVHPALLPAFGGKGFYGLHVHEAALARGVKVAGATVHYVNEIADGGEIILQKAVDVLPGDTPETLQRRVMEQAEWEILPKAVEIVAERLGNAE